MFTDPAAWVDGDLPKGKQRRYGVVQLVSLVVFDMFRARGLSSDDAGFASNDLGFEIERLNGDMQDIELDPDPVCGYLEQTIKSTDGYIGRKVDSICDERQDAINAMSKWFKEPVNAQPLDLKMWGEEPKVIDAVAVMASLREAYKSARQTAERNGYCISGLNIFKVDDLTSGELDR